MFRSFWVFRARTFIGAYRIVCVVRGSPNGSPILEADWLFPVHRVTSEHPLVRQTGSCETTSADLVILAPHALLNAWLTPGAQIEDLGMIAKAIAGEVRDDHSQARL